MRTERPETPMAAATSPTSARNSTSRITFAPGPVESVENSAESRMMAPKSPIDAPAITSCPNRERLWPASFSTGITRPNEVAVRIPRPAGRR